MIKAAEAGSQVAVHLLVAFGVTWAVTGSVAAGSLTALAEASCNVVAHHYHHRLWAAIRRRFGGSGPVATV